MEYITTKQAASMWNVTSRTVNRLCAAGKIAGAKLVGKTWFMPSNAIRPLDGRTRIAAQVKDHIEEKVNRFIFPIIPYSTHIHSIQYFHEEEKILYEAQLNFYRCKYIESYNTLTKLIKTAKSIFVRLGCLYTLCELSILFGHHKTFEDYRNEFRKLFNTDFPYKDEIRVLSISLDNYDSYSGDTHNKYSELIKMKRYDSHVFPFFYTSYTFVLMCDYILKHRLADLEGIEIVVMQMQTENIPLVLQSMHVYMSVMYQLSGQNEKANEHLKAALDIALETGFYHSIVLSHQMIAYSWDKVIAQYDSSIKEYVLEKKAFVMQNYMGGHVAKEMFKSPKSGYYLELALYVLNGFTNKEIAQIMNISESKVRNRISQIFDRMGVSNRKELSEYALKLLKKTNINSAVML